MGVFSARCDACLGWPDWPAHDSGDVKHSPSAIALKAARRLSPAVLALKFNASGLKHLTSGGSGNGS